MHDMKVLTQESKNSKKSKDFKVLNIVLIIVAVLTIVFTAICLWMFYLFQQIPDTLVTMFYTTVVGELLVAGIIKVTKTKYGEGGNIDEFRDISEDS